jgi:hypothetical protein
MKDADDPIPVPTPEDTIFLSDAFVLVYRVLTPDWRILEELLNPAPPYYYDARQEEDAKNRGRRKALNNRDKAQRRANEWLREKIIQGALRALVRDPGDPNSKPPRPPQTFKLSRRGWAMSDFETGIDGDHVGPGDVLQSGPNTIIAGERRPVFFDRKEFDNVMKEIAPTDVERAAHPGKLAPTKPKALSAHQIRSGDRRQRIREIDNQLREEGFEGLQKERREAIRSRFPKNKPSDTTIRRALKPD